MQKTAVFLFWVTRLIFDRHSYENSCFFRFDMNSFGFPSTSKVQSFPSLLLSFLLSPFYSELKRGGLHHGVWDAGRVMILFFVLLDTEKNTNQNLQKEIKFEGCEHFPAPTCWGIQHWVSFSFFLSHSCCVLVLIFSFVFLGLSGATWPASALWTPLPCRVR